MLAQQLHLRFRFRFFGLISRFLVFFLERGDNHGHVPFLVTIMATSPFFSTGSGADCLM